MLCSDIMKSEPECMGPTVPVIEAARRMLEANIGFLPVCDPSGTVLGTITDRDITIRVVARQLPLTTPIGQVMTHEVVTCSATDDVGRARQLMERHRKSRIICVDAEGHLQGVISLSDMAELGDASNTLREVAQRESRVRLPSPSDYDRYGGDD
jgi:CBS domain-containing protein